MMEPTDKMFYDLLEIDTYPDFTESLYADIFDYYGGGETTPRTYKTYQYGMAEPIEEPLTVDEGPIEDVVEDVLEEYEEYEDNATAVSEYDKAILEEVMRIRKHLNS